MSLVKILRSVPLVRTAIVQPLALTAQRIPMGWHSGHTQPHAGHPPVAQNISRPSSVLPPAERRQAHVGNQLSDLAVKRAEAAELRAKELRDKAATANSQMEIARQSRKGLPGQHEPGENGARAAELLATIAAVRYQNPAQDADDEAARYRALASDFRFKPKR